MLFRSSNMLYIGIRTTVANPYGVEVGAMGNLNPNAHTYDGVETSQIEFKLSATPLAISNQIGGTIAGIVAASSFNNGITTLEIAMPIYANWQNASTAMNLFSGMHIFEYATIANTSWSAANSQNAAGEYLSYYFGAPMDFATDMTLVPEPVSMVLLGLGGLLLRRR